ncbi:hypothetical protein PaecuDRAFT_3073 [Paenibacillus curdlanolyticus YK9]|uniref:YcxB-like C-terminal domain-containing protein n=1 Tax=Paenibacillus curdlanolyticus YK9 TaxID=717606 RepID=E0IBN4_9BACL|nr:YcxB family protein [Paenibacillus curdlanolyticus]EFM10114.1 hypothetical protein PaecuDRAFT_3073 [Paenibacillus curdlanolyticus YK9]
MANPLTYCELRYKLTLADYRHFSIHHNRKATLRLACLYYGLFLGAAWAAGGEAKSGFPVIALGFLLCLAIGCCARLGLMWQIWREFRANRHLHEEQWIAINEQGIRIQTPSSDLTLKWSELLLASETPLLFTLYVAPDQGCMIPKRLVNARAFREGLQRHVEAGKLQLR